MACSNESLKNLASHDEQGPEVIDIRVRRPRHHQIAKRAEKTISVVAVEKRIGLQAQHLRSGQRVGAHLSTGVVFHAVDAVGVGGQHVNARFGLQRDRATEQELGGAAAQARGSARAQALGMKGSDFLDRNDAYNFFKPLDDLVVTGPTFTNVNDFRAMLVL